MYAADKIYAFITLMMFSKSARYYDLIYSDKDYTAETRRLVDLIRQNLGHTGNSLLDVACGTGRHIEHLKAVFDVQGMDLDPQLLALAQRRNPEITFHTADMRDFDLGQQFDIVTCLFSAIGYVASIEGLEQAVACMARHVRPGGLLIIEPWFSPENWHPGTVHASIKEDGDLKIVRMNTSKVTGRLSWFDFHYLVGTPEGTAHFVERHELYLFTRAETEAAFADAGLAVFFEPEGLTGRGLYIGKKPA